VPIKSSSIGWAAFFCPPKGLTKNSLLSEVKKAITISKEHPILERCGVLTVEENLENENFY
jgi:hypothetical protein